MKVRLTGLVAGIAFAVAFVRLGLAAIAVPVFAVCLILAVLVTEVGRARPEPDEAGRARPRGRIRDYAGGWPMWSVLLTATVLLVGLGFVAAAGMPQPGYVGRWYWYWPTGWRAPAGLADVVATCIGTVVLTILLGAIAVRAAVRAPRAGADEAVQARDERWRRALVDSIVATAGLILSLLLAGWSLVVTMATAVDATAAFWLVLAAVLTASAFTAALAHAAVLLAPAPSGLPRGVASSPSEIDSQKWSIAVKGMAVKARVAGLAAGLATAIVLGRCGLAVLGPPAFALVLIVGVLVSELGRVRPEPDQSGAPLEVRRIRDYVSGGFRYSLLAIGTVLLFQFAKLRSVHLGSEPMSIMSGGGIDRLYSGSLATAGLTALWGWLAAWATVRAPRAGADSAIRARDERWRRSMMGTITATSGLILSALLAGWSIVIVMSVDPSCRGVETVAMTAGALGTVGGVAGVSTYGAISLRSPVR